MDIESWTVEDVQSWLKSEKASPAAIEQFRAQEINGEALLTLEEADLVSLGLETMGPRRILYKKIQKLRGVDIVKVLQERDTAPRSLPTEETDSGHSGHVDSRSSKDASPPNDAKHVSNGSKSKPASEGVKHPSEASKQGVPSPPESAEIAANRRIAPNEAPAAVAATAPSTAASAAARARLASNKSMPRVGLRI
jgi:hypothetical protein